MGGKRSDNVRRLAALIVVDPEQVKTALLNAYRETGACQSEAAKKLDISYRTYSIWVDKLELRDALDEMAAEAKRDGWHHDRNQRGGHPVVPNSKRQMLLRRRRRAEAEKGAR